MKDLNFECWKMGILSKTQHNEVAPAQHEMAPIYTTANIATDHNQLIMECMKRVANRHGLECLLHEKPFKGVNGSGKHNNWSLITNTGKNLLDSGTTPHENVQFLLFLAAALRAVDENADLLRLSASNAGNDHRLGAHEAPPAIISIFVGEQLDDVLSQLVETGEAIRSKECGKFSVGVHRIPAFSRDATDRNRTSPFAFTGNKFEFRMVGSSMSIAEANTVLNTIFADVLCDMADILEAAKDFDLAVHDLIKKTVSDHYRIIYSGNGYSKEWVEEAKRRGLPNYEYFLDAVPALVSKKSIQLFEKHNVYSRTELISRVEIEYENYSKIINIEGKTMVKMASTKFIPAVIKYMKELAESINAVKAVSPDLDVSSQEELLIEISSLLGQAQKALKHLKECVKVAEEMQKGAVKAQKCIEHSQNGVLIATYFKDKVIPAMESLRQPIDELELIVSEEVWPVPTYGDMLFEI